LRTERAVAASLHVDPYVVIGRILTGEVPERAQGQSWQEVVPAGPSWEEIFVRMSKGEMEKHLEAVQTAAATGAARGLEAAREAMAAGLSVLRVAEIAAAAEAAANGAKVGHAAAVAARQSAETAKGMATKVLRAEETRIMEEKRLARAVTEEGAERVREAALPTPEVG
jgi:hypothetical protein